MKYGFCGNAAKAALLAPGTIDYVELNLTNISGMSDEDLKKASADLAAIGVPAEATNCFFPKTIRLCGRDYNRETVAEYSKAALDKAARLGVHTCVLGSGGSRNVDEGENFDACMKQFEEVLWTVGEAAKEYGTIVVIEPLNKKETNIINTVGEGAVLCRRVNHPNVKLLADIYHVALAEEPMTNLSDNGDILRHVHIAYVDGRTAPMPTDSYDYAAVKKALDDAKYDLRISIEGKIQGDFAETMTNSIAYLRTIFG